MKSDVCTGYTALVSFWLFHTMDFNVLDAAILNSFGQKACIEMTTVLKRTSIDVYVIDKLSFILGICLLNPLLLKTFWFIIITLTIFQGLLIFLLHFRISGISCIFDNKSDLLEK